MGAYSNLKVGDLIQVVDEEHTGSWNRGQLGVILTTNHDRPPFAAISGWDPENVTSIDVFIPTAGRSQQFYPWQVKKLEDESL